MNKKDCRQQLLRQLYKNNDPPDYDRYVELIKTGKTDVDDPLDKGLSTIQLIEIASIPEEYQDELTEKCRKASFRRKSRLKRK